MASFFLGKKPNRVFGFNNEKSALGKSAWGGKDSKNHELFRNFEQNMYAEAT